MGMEKSHDKLESRRHFCQCKKKKEDSQRKMTHENACW